MIGFLPGQNGTTLLISSHHDAVWDGAVEDGSGTSEVLALARHFRALKKVPAHVPHVRDHGFPFHRLSGPPRSSKVRRERARKWNGRGVNFAIEHIARHGYVDEKRQAEDDQPAEIAGILENVGEASERDREG